MSEQSHGQYYAQELGREAPDIPRRAFGSGATGVGRYSVDAT